MKKIFGDLGTMCLGITAILIASVIISLGTDEGPQLVSVVGSLGLGVLGVVLRMVSNDAGDSVGGG